MKYSVLSVMISIALLIGSGVLAAQESTTPRSSKFDGLFRVDLGMNSDQVIDTYGQAFPLPCNPDEPTLEISWNKVNQGSRLFQRLRATTDGPYIPEQPDDYDYMFLIDDRLECFNMVRWGPLGLYDSFVDYLSNDLALGEPLAALPADIRSKYGIICLAENGSGSYWLDENSADVLFVQFRPGDTDSRSNVTVGLARKADV